MTQFKHSIENYRLNIQIKLTLFKLCEKHKNQAIIVPNLMNSSITVSILFSFVWLLNFFSHSQKNAFPVYKILQVQKQCFYVFELNEISKSTSISYLMHIKKPFQKIFFNFLLLFSYNFFHSFCSFKIFMCLVRHATISIYIILLSIYIYSDFIELGNELDSNNIGMCTLCDRMKTKNLKEKLKINSHIF